MKQERKNKMADVEEHEGNLTEDTNTVENVTTSLTEKDSHEGVCSIVASDNSSEILLYVEDGNQGVQDLIRVALNQSLSTGELQQQLQSTGTGITLENLGEAHAIISMQQDHVSQTADGQLITTESQEQHQESHIETKESDMNNLFQLANLSGALSSETERKFNEDSMIEIGRGIKIPEQKEELKNQSGVGCSGGVVIEDYIIANIDSKETGKMPGNTCFI